MFKIRYITILNIFVPILANNSKVTWRYYYAIFLNFFIKLNTYVSLGNIYVNIFQFSIEAERFHARHSCTVNMENTYSIYLMENSVGSECNI